jgi:tetratricopeptide (TPR) repeat protein
LALSELAARSQNVMAYGAILSSRWYEVEQHGRAGQALFARLGNRAMEVDCLCQLLIALVNTGRTQEGLAAGRQAQAIALEIDNKWGQVNSDMQLTTAFLDSGDYGRALPTAQEAVALARSTNLAAMLPMCLIRLAQVYRAILNLAQAATVLDEAQTVNEQITSRPFAAVLAAERCALAAIQGHWQEAAEQTAQVRHFRPHSLLYTGFTCWFEVAALYYTGRIAEAQTHLDSFQEAAATNPRLRLPYLRAQAVAAEWAGRQKEAVDYLIEALTLARQMALPGEAWPILVSLAQQFQAAGQAGQAQQYWEEAATLLSALANSMTEDNSRAALLNAAASAGVPPTYRHP